MSDSSASLRHQRSRSLEEVLPATGYVASQVTVINNMNAPGTQNTNVFNSPSPTTKRRSIQRWIDEEEERGRRSSTPVQRPATRRGHYEAPKTDRDSLSSQQTFAPLTTLSRQGAVRRMVNIPPPAFIPTEDGGRQPVTPYAVAQSAVSRQDMAAFGMPHLKGFSENKNQDGRIQTVVEKPAMATAPTFRPGHRRNKTTLSDIKKILPRDVPQKGAAHNAEGFRAVGGQFAPQPATPQREALPISGFAPDTPSTSGIFATSNCEDKKFKAESSPSTPTRSTNTSGHPRMEDVSNYSPSTPSSLPILGDSPLSGKEVLDVFPKIVERMSSDWLDSSSTVTAEKWNAFEETRSLKSIADSPASFEDGSDQETPLPEPEGSSPSPLRLRRVDNLNFGPEVDYSDTPRSVARVGYSIENVRYADAADGTAVFDFFFASGTWPRQEQRRVRFKSNPSFQSAPLVHRRAGSDSSNESAMIDIDMDDSDESDSEVPRGTLRIVNGSDSDEEDEVTELPVILWNPRMGDEYPVASNDTSKRDEEIKVRKTMKTAAADDEGSDLEPFDDSKEQVVPVNKHKRGGSLELLRPTLDTVGKCATLCTGAVTKPIVSSPAANTSVKRQPLPSNTGFMDTGFQFPVVAPPKEQRVSSMPFLSGPTHKITNGEKKNKKLGSFSNLLESFSRPKDERNLLRKDFVEKKPKKSFRQRLSQQLDESFLPGSWKSAWQGEYQTKQLFFTGG
jgi:hypothetical protein